MFKSGKPNANFNLYVLVLIGNFNSFLILVVITLSILSIFYFWSINAGKPYNNLDLWKYPNISMIDLTLKNLLFNI